MNAIDETYPAFLALCAELAGQGPRKAVLVTLVGSGGRGQAAGRRAWALADATLRGTLTLGSCADGQLRREVEAVRESGAGRLVSLDLGSGDDYEFGLTCSGQVSAQLTPMSPGHPLWAWLAARREAGKDVQVFTPLGGGAGPTWARSAAGDLSPQAVPDETGAFTEHRPAPPTLLIVGAGPVAPPLARLARTLGLRVVVTDDQAGRMTPAHLPDAHERLIVPAGHDLLLPELRPGDGVAVLSHDYAHELSVLGRVLGGPARYVALVASRRRGQALLRFMAETGTPPGVLARLRTPAGLDLGLSSPAGIALSVLSEYVQTVEGTGAQPLSGRTE
ncbi:XdhC family protein [Deinococcus sp.]|uniref:XdhC family protein n=1 Tax=Deinococcus sp. TaxID=47478 RepID=UPI0025BD5B77|nr:XdhC/CoxI family protein [Deinococcus sp.]